MGQLPKNQKGFGAVMVVLVLVIVALVGTVGYVVYKGHPKTTTASTTTNTTATADPYAGWLTYASQPNSVTIKYPATYLASSNDTALFLATTQAEKQQNDSCAKAQECSNFNFGITTQSFKKNSAETYTDVVKRNSYSPSTTAIAKINGYNAYENADAVKAEIGSEYLNFVYIDLPSRVVLIQGQFSQQSDLATFNKIAASATFTP